MKNLIAAVILVIPLTVLAQNPYSASGNQYTGGYPGGQGAYGGMNQADMNNMMQQMQEAQACMEKIDQNELHKLEKRAKQFETNIRTMCKAGKRSEAQSKALAFSKEVMNNKSMQELRRCSEKMQGAMKGMMAQMQNNMPMMNNDVDYSKTHVCDDFK